MDGMGFLAYFWSDIDIVLSTFWRGLESKIVAMAISKSLCLQTFGSKDTETETSCVKLLVLLPSLKLFKIWGWTKTNRVSLYDFTAAMEKAEHLKRLREREVGRKTFPGAPNYELCECTKDYITCIFYRGIHHWVNISHWKLTHLISPENWWLEDSKDDSFPFKVVFFQTWWATKKKPLLVALLFGMKSYPVYLGII